MLQQLVLSGAVLTQTSLVQGNELKRCAYRFHAVNNCNCDDLCELTRHIRECFSLDGDVAMPKRKRMSRTASQKHGCSATRAPAAIARLIMQAQWPYASIEGVLINLELSLALTTCRAMATMASLQS